MSGSYSYVWSYKLRRRSLKLCRVAKVMSGPYSYVRLLKLCLVVKVMSAFLSYVGSLNYVGFLKLCRVVKVMLGS